MTTRYDRQVARAARLAESAQYAPSHVPSRRVRFPQRTGVLPIKNVSGEIIPAYSLVMQQSGVVENESYLPVIKVPSSNPGTFFGGPISRLLLAVQDEIAINGYGYGVSDGWAKLRVYDSEVSSMLSSFSVRSVAPLPGSFHVTTNLGAFRTKYDATKAQLWGSSSGPYLVDALMHTRRLSESLSIWGEIVSTGPAGEADYTDHRYFFNPYRAGPQFKYITVANMVEYLEFGVSATTHFIPPLTAVSVSITGSTPSTLVYGFSLPVPMVFDMIVTAVSGTDWNTQSVTGKTYDARNGVAYGPSRTILVASVPANVLNSFGVLAVNDRCACVLSGASGQNMVFVAKTGTARATAYTTIAPGLGVTIAAN